ncbi:hypothetical protein GCM10009799_02790 [Nocardiopsis rhodophaea]|uniref:Uncharacterized protein n=1 Tax=Nocardiopsis rhodophaea TaxID=280238 RepID=A0ABN2S716_9ACTN
MSRRSLPRAAAGPQEAEADQNIHFLTTLAETTGRMNYRRGIFGALRGWSRGGIAEESLSRGSQRNSGAISKENSSTPWVTEKAAVGVGAARHPPPPPHVRARARCSRHLAKA